MTGNVGGIRPGTPSPDDARRAAEAARTAPAAPPPPKPSAPTPAGDRSGLDAGRTGLEAQAGPLGHQDMASGPAGAADDMDGFDGFGVAPAAAPLTAGAKAAVDYVGATLAQLQGPPAKAAEATAALLGNPQQFADQLKVLQGLQGTPGFDAIRAQVDQIAALATPANLAKNLGEGPFSKETITNLARLRAIDDPALQGALDKAALAILPKLAPGDFDEATAVLVSPLANKPDPATQQALGAKVEEWARQAYDATVGDKHSEKGVKKGLEEFQQQLASLAEKTGLGPKIEAAAGTVLNAKKDDIEHKSKENRSLWDRVTGGISGLIEGVTSGLGKALKFATDGIGKVAHFAINVTGKIQTFGLDLGAAALDAVGADGAAKTVRGASEFVKKTYDAVGNQVQLFAEGAGSAFRDTVTGLGATIAHPIQTIEGIAHLVTHPGEIPKVAKALWDTATEKGPAYALGYLAGNVVPALLSGGSSTEASLGARIGAIAGESEVLTNVARIAGEVGEAARATRLGSLAVDGYSAAAKVAGRVTEFTSVPFKAVGKLVGKSEQIEQVVAFVRSAGEALGDSPLGKTVERLKGAYEERVATINTSIEKALKAGVNGLEDTGLGKRIVAATESRVPQAVERAATRSVEAEALTKVDRGIGIVAETETERGVLESTGMSIDEVREANAKGLGKNAGMEANDRLFVGATPEHDAGIANLEDPRTTRYRKQFKNPPPDVANIEGVTVEQGTYLRGARGHGGSMATLKADVSNPKLAKAIEEARALGADGSLTQAQKLQFVRDAVGGTEGQAGLFRAASTDADTQRIFEEVNAVGKGEKYRANSNGLFLDAGVGDCRNYAVASQHLLQEAVPELNPRIIYVATAEKTANGLTVGVNHAINVITVDGEEIVFDSILPHLSGIKLKEFVNEGVFGRIYRPLEGSFDEIGDIWAGAGTAFNTVPGTVAAAGQLGQQR
ncbi:MAG: hypothetical protein JWM80_210 [Cyanobacteria bacterium RYN_339]|nr:hypothetical protein [Cyanobacteria bacterium RYN_339]